MASTWVDALRTELQRRLCNQPLHRVAPSHHRYKEVTAVRVWVDVSLHRASEAECVTAENLVTGAFEGSSRIQRLKCFLDKGPHSPHRLYKRHGICLDLRLCTQRAGQIIFKISSGPTCPRQNQLSFECANVILNCLRAPLTAARCGAHYLPCCSGCFHHLCTIIAHNHCLSLVRQRLRLLRKMVDDKLNPCMLGRCITADISVGVKQDV